MARQPIDPALPDGDPADAANRLDGSKERAAARQAGFVGHVAWKEGDPAIIVAGEREIARSGRPRKEVLAEKGLRHGDV